MPAAIAIRRFLWVALLPLLLLAPRAVRILSPRAWAEDEQFLGAAGLLEQGFECYRDFVHNNPPALEYLMALAFRLCGRELLVAELLSALFAWGACLALLRIGRATAPGVGPWAAALLACSALFFRYHVFEREVFLVALVALAWAVSPAEPARGRRQTLVVAALLGAALCVKLSAALPILAYLLWGLAHRRSWRQLLGLGLLSALPCALLLGWYSLHHGAAVWLQLIAFLAAKGTNAPGLADRLALLAALLEPLLVLAIAWLVGGLRRLSPRGVAGFAMLWIAVELGIKLGFKRTLWPHNFLPLLVPGALLGGLALAGMVRWLRARRPPAVRGAIAAAVVLALLIHWWRDVRVWSEPGASDPPPTSVLVHGFGGIQRAELDGALALLRARAQPGDIVVATSDWIPALSGLEPLYRFWESHGVWSQLHRAWEEGRLAEHLRAQRGKDFKQRLQECIVEYLPPLEEALEQGRLRFLVGIGAFPVSTALGLQGGTRRLSPPGTEIVVEEVLER